MENDWQNQISNLTKQERLARKILGVSDDANSVEIKKAYWLLAMECHPDKHPNDQEKNRRFQNILNAYNFLMNKDNNVQLTNLKEEGKIGKFNDNEWGYFCWWRESYY